VSTLRFLGRPLFAALAVLSAAAIIAGCSGSPSGVTPQTSMQVPSQSRIPVMPDASGCTHTGKVKVKPCSVTLTESSPTADVTVKAPKKDTVSEADNCGGEAGEGTVTQEGTGNTWVVTAGATTGSCTATFTSQNKKDKQTGSAPLSITNSV
jgi:hypothetical protein